MIAVNPAGDQAVSFQGLHEVTIGGSSTPAAAWDEERGAGFLAIPISNRFPASGQHQSHFPLFLFIELRPAFSELAFESTQVDASIDLLKLLLETIEQL